MPKFGMRAVLKETGEAQGFWRGLAKSVSDRLREREGEREK